MLYDIDAIRVGGRRRPADPGKVRALAASIAEVGLLNPITVLRDGSLVAGLHRLEACRSLALTEVEVSVIDLDPLDAELAEIDENLQRNELTVLEQAEHLDRRDHILREKGLRAERGENRFTVRRGEIVSPLRTTAEVAADMGMSERSAQLRTQIARNLLPAVKDAIRDLPIADSTTQLLALARLEPGQQMQAASKLVSGAADVHQAAKAVRQDERLATPPQPIPDAIALVHADHTRDVRDFSMDAIITDPPYGISHYGGATKVGSHLVSADFDGADAWDSADPAEFQERLYDWAEEWERILKPGGAVVAFTDRALISHLWDALKRVNLKPKQIIVWVKVNPSPAGLARHNLISATEFMVWAVKPGAEYTFNEVDGWDRRNVIVTPIIGGAENADHPTQKPLAVMSKLIALTTKPGDIVLDPFAGSGSTGIAAHRLGRRAHLIEQNAQYIALARERLSQETPA